MVVIYLLAQIWSGIKTYGGSNIDILRNVDFYAPDNAVIFHFELSSSYKIDNTSGSDFVIIKSNPYGTSIWERVIGVSNLNDWAYDIDYDANGNILVVGISCTPDGGSFLFCSGLPSAQNYGFVIKISSADGSIINTIRLYDNWGNSTIGNYIRVLSVKSTNDGGFVIGGEIKYERQQGFSWVSVTQGFVAKFDQNNNLQWIRAVGDTTMNILDYRGVVSVFQASDGNIIAVSTAYSQIWVGKFNVNNGNLIWQRSYSRTRGVHRLSWAKLSSDGSVIIADNIKTTTDSANVLFVKLNSDGSFACARMFGTINSDVAIDVKEGSNYYYITGYYNSADKTPFFSNLFYAKINKSNCSLVGSVRYLLPVTSEGRGISLKGGIVYITGWTDNASFSNGNRDGILAADSGIQDTCYWRSILPDVNQSVSLSASSNWNIYNNVSVSLYNPIYTSLNVNVAKKSACGMLTPVDNGEFFENCEIVMNFQDRTLKIISKTNSIKNLKIYKIDGTIVYEKEFSDKELSVNLKSGVYILKMSYDGKVIQRKLFIRR